MLAGIREQVSAYTQFRTRFDCLEVYAFTGSFLSETRTRHVMWVFTLTFAHRFRRVGKLIHSGRLQSVPGGTIWNNWISFRIQTVARLATLWSCTHLSWRRAYLLLPTTTSLVLGLLCCVRPFDELVVANLVALRVYAHLHVSLQTRFRLLFLRFLLLRSLFCLGLIFFLDWFLRN